MALQALNFDTVKEMSPTKRTRYFENYAGYFADAPKEPYAIRIGSKTLHSDDTHDLRMKFDAFLDRGYKAETLTDIADRLTAAGNYKANYGKAAYWSHIVDQKVADRLMARAVAEDKKGYVV